jgi:hypothetical protein
MKLTKEIPVEFEFADRQSIVVGEEKIRVSLSPYDVPSLVRISYDEVVELLQIRFVYLTPDEPTSQRELDEVRIELGSYSNKLYAIYVSNVTSENLPTIGEKCKSAVERLLRDYNKEEPKNYLPYMNLSLAKDFLKTHTQLFAF